MYSLVRPLLFALEAETAHHFTLATLRAFDGLGLIPAAATAPDNCARSIMGIRFPNPVGLAAGLDKNGEYIDALDRLGFGNHGVDRLVENVKRARYRGVLGINIGKNADTPLERAADDYLACLRK